MWHTVLGAPAGVLGALALALLHPACTAGVHADLHGKTATTLRTKTQAGETLFILAEANVDAKGLSVRETPPSTPPALRAPPQLGPSADLSALRADGSSSALIHPQPLFTVAYSGKRLLLQATDKKLNYKGSLRPLATNDKYGVTVGVPLQIHWLGEETEARCMDGSRFGYYFRPASSASSAKKWVIELQGGGCVYITFETLLA